MEKLLDQTDAIVLSSTDGVPVRPNFEIPVELTAHTNPHHFLEVKENPSKGRGWFSKQNIPAGTVLLVAKPIAWVIDCEWDGMEDDETADEMEDVEDSDEPEEGEVNGFLVLETLKAIKENPSIWLEQVTHLYPRESVDIQASKAWISKDGDIFSRFQKMVEELESIPALRGKSKEISQRLPLIIRYNILSVETCPELLSYPGPTGHSSLAGVGLFYLPSFFNHDSRPNTSRYAVGNVMWFVANQDIPAGNEVCISYLEHDILCESVKRRNAMMTLDFKEAEDTSAEAPIDEGGPDFPMIDSDLQNELMGMPIFERLDSIDQLLRQATGEAAPETDGIDDDAMDAEEQGEWYKCDVQNLRILKAITLEGMAKATEALPIWEECVNFASSFLPPNDESLIAMHVQSALCALTLKDMPRATQHAACALQVHNVMFSGGVVRFRRRYQKDFCLKLRPDTRKEGKALEDILWPYS